MLKLAGIGYKFQSNLTETILVHKLVANHIDFNDKKGEYVVTQVLNRIN